MERHHQNLHISHNWHLSEVLKNKYNDLVLADTFRQVALSIISLFIPIYLLQLGVFSFTQIAWMELLSFMGCIFGHYYILANITSWGVKRTMIVSYFFNIILYLLLFYSKGLINSLGSNYYLILVALLDMIGMSFYWSAHNVYFLGVTEKSHHQGRRLGLLLAIPSLVGIVGPFLGSVLIESFGFHVAFLVSTVFLIFAAYILTFTDDVKIEIKLNIKSVLDLKGFRKNIIFMIQGVSYLATGLLWPLLLFGLSVKLVSVGFLYLISGSGFAIVNYFGGKSSDGVGARKNSRIGALGHAFFLTLRALSTTILAMTTFQTLDSFFHGLLQICLTAGFFKHAHENVGNAIMNRELYMYLGRILIVVVFLVALLYFAFVEALIFGIIFSAMLILGLNLIIKNDFSLVN